MANAPALKWQQVLEVFDLEVLHTINRAGRGARFFEASHRLMYKEP